MRIGYDAKRAFHNMTGLGNYSRDLIRIMSSFAPTDKHILFNPKPRSNQRLQLSDTMEEVQPKSWFYKTFSSFWRYKHLAKVLPEYRLDIYHGLSAELPQGIEHTGIPSVVTVHDLIFMRYPKLYSAFDRRMHIKKVRHACQVADLVIAISEQTKKDLIDYLHVPDQKIVVVYQGCHAVFKQPQTPVQIQKVLDTHKLPKDFILNVGTIEPRKNALLLLKAVANTNDQIVLVGKKTNYQQLLDPFIKKHKMRDRVHFLSGLTLEELAALYQQAQMLVYPSVFEGFGIPIVEALYSRTPVITTKGGCFAEAGGPHSYYINPTSVSELQACIQEIQTQKANVNNRVEKGWEYAQQFRDNVIAEELLAIYSRYKKH
ncbi:MAG: glycosyltransferase family 4 protein [Flavobacteriaceae bacterium]|nr:glycosyltransferase family 4 protein [Flavobacteriaceae bacterium]